jgi:hypothetical protein
LSQKRQFFCSSSSFMDRRKSHVAAGPSVRLGKKIFGENIYKIITSVPARNFHIRNVVGPSALKYSTVRAGLGPARPHLINKNAHKTKDWRIQTRLSHKQGRDFLLLHYRYPSLVKILSVPLLVSPTEILCYRNWSDHRNLYGFVADHLCQQIGLFVDFIHLLDLNWPSNLTGSNPWYAQGALICFN